MLSYKEALAAITQYAQPLNKVFVRLSKALAWERQDMKRSKFPLGWDEKRVRRVLKHYEQQTEEEAVAEDEAAFDDSNQAVMEVPRELVPTIRELIAKHHGSRGA